MKAASIAEPAKVEAREATAGSVRDCFGEVEGRRRFISFDFGED
jgi:hypothetical protein